MDFKQLRNTNQYQARGIWSKIQTNAEEFFQKNGWPHRGLEEWHYTSLASWKDRTLMGFKPTETNSTKTSTFKNKSKLTGVSLPHLQKSNLSNSDFSAQIQKVLQNYLQSFASESISLVFVNGVFSKEHSDLDELERNQVSILTGKDFLKNTKEQSFIYEFIHERRQVQFRPQSSMEALNSAACSDGVFIRINKEQALSLPLHIIHISLQTGHLQNSDLTLAANQQNQKFVQASEKSNSNSEILSPKAEKVLASLPKVFIEVGPFSKAEIVESYIGQDTYLMNATSEIILRKSSRVNYCKIAQDSATATHVSATRFFQHDSSSLDCRTVVLGGQLTRLNLEFYLRQPDAHLVSKGFYIGSKEQHIDHSSLIDHVVGNCQSVQLYKGLLADSAKGIFDGKVLIRKQSQKASSDQLIKNLLLSKKAEANSKPQLMIYADDVKATHGSTVGQLNPEEIFYFQSRAIDKAKAIQMLSLGFVEEIILEIENAQTQKFLQRLTEQRYKDLN